MPSRVDNPRSCADTTAAQAQPVPRFAAGDRVQIRQAWPIGHCRTPWYARGACGVVERYCGAFPNPEELAHGRSGLPAVALYRIRLSINALRKDYRGPPGDTLEVEIYEHWLQPSHPDTSRGPEQGT